MYARILYVGSSPLGKADFGYRICEVLRDAGHAVQACPDPGESSCGKVALPSMVETFRPTLLLWDLRLVNPAPFSEEIEAVDAMRVALTEGALSAGAPFDAELRLRFPGNAAEARAASSLPVIWLDAVADSRYAASVLSDATVAREGVVVVNASVEEALGAQAGRASSLNDVLRETGSNPAYSLRTFRSALWGSTGDAPSPSSVAMRRAEGLEVLVEDPHRAPEGCVQVPAGGVGEAIAAMAGEDSFTDAPGMPLELSLPEALEGLATLAASEGRPEVAPYAERATVLACYGWLGAHNFGDDLLLRIVCDRVSTRLPNAQFFAIGADARALRCEFGLAAAMPHEKALISTWLARSAAVVYCGGLLFDQPMARTAGDLEFCLDPWIEPSGQAAVALLAASLGVRPVMLGIGAGPVAMPATKQAIRLLGMAGTLFLARDENTAGLLLAAGAPSESVHEAVDLVLGGLPYVEQHTGLVPAPVREAGGYFVISLRRWPGLPRGFEAKVARALDRIVALTGLRAVFLPFDVADVEIHHVVAGLMEEGGSSVLLEERPGEGTLLGTIRGSAFAVAMRLHCSVLHHVLGKPSFGLSYNDKIEAYFGVVNQQDCLFPLDFDEDALVGVVESAWRKPQERVARISNAVSDRAGIVDWEFERLFEVIREAGDMRREAGDVLYPRSKDRHELDAQRLEARCAALEARARELEDEVRALRSSTSFRLGNALVRPLARLRGGR